MNDNLREPNNIEDFYLTFKYHVDIKKFEVIIYSNEYLLIQRAIRKCEKIFKFEFNTFFIQKLKTNDKFKIQGIYSIEMQLKDIYKIIQILRDNFEDMDYEYIDNDIFSLSDLSFFQVNEPIYKTKDDILSLKIFNKGTKLLNVKIFDNNYKRKEVL